MIKIRLFPGEKATLAMRRLKKICEREGVFKDFAKSIVYEKPSEIRRRKRARSKKVIKKLESEQRESQQVFS